MRLDGSESPMVVLRQSLRDEFVADESATKGEVCQRAADDLLARLDGSDEAVHETVVELASLVYDQVARVTRRSRASVLDGHRSTEIAYSGGERVDMAPMQLTLPDVREVAGRKVEAGAAALTQGRVWNAIANEADVVAARRRLDPATTRLCDVLTEERVAEIVAETDGRSAA